MIGTKGARMERRAARTRGAQDVRGEWRCRMLLGSKHFVNTLIRKMRQIWQAT